MTRVDDVQDISGQHAVRAQGVASVASDPPERQAVDIKPMRYVLAISLVVAIVAMASVYLAFQA